MKIKFGALVVAGSGKIGGHVASKNRAGAYIRTKVTPSNPRTSAQSASRAILGTLSVGWSLLTESQRLGWSNAVSQFATTDIFGDIKNPSGINLYVKLNANLLNSGQGVISDAPAKLEMPFSSIASVIFDVSTPANSFITFTDDTLGAYQILISATKVVSNGTSFVKNLFRNIGISSPLAGELQYGTLFIQKFGTPSAGDKFFIKVEIVLPNGQKSTPQTSVVIATA